MSDEKIDKLLGAEDKWKKEFGESVQRYQLEERERWREWCIKIPAIEFPAGWKVKIIPPFCGAMARMWITLPGSDKNVSVYLDVYDRLGFYGSPYWEVHPYHGDCGRCDMNDTAELLKMIADRSEGDMEDER